MEDGGYLSLHRC